MISLNPLIIIRFYFKQVEKRINWMDNLKKLSLLKNDRCLFEKSIAKRANKKNEEKIMNSFAEQATHLIQAEKLSIKFFAFGNKISNLLRRQYKEVWHLLKRRDQALHEFQQSLLYIRNRKFTIKVLSALNKKVHLLKMNGFKSMKLKAFQRKLEKLIAIDLRIKLRLAFQKCKELQQRNELSLLDISQIIANNIDAHAHAYAGQDSRVFEDQSVVKKEGQKKQKIKSHLTVNQQNEKGSLPPESKREVVLVEQDERCTNPFANQGKRSQQRGNQVIEIRNDGNLSIIIKKLIRKNYELEQKLQMIYGILDHIQTDSSTKIGSMIQNLKRKTIGNLQLQNE